MDSLIQLIIITSLFCFGFNYVVTYIPMFEYQAGRNSTEIIPKEREVLWFIRFYGNRYLPVWIQKPLYSCPMCMASIWGSIFYWGSVLNTDQIINSLTLIKWVAVVVAVSGLNRIIKGIAQI